MNIPVLHTERMELREIHPEHAEDYFDVMGRDEVTQYYGMDSLKEIKQAKELIESFHTTKDAGRGMRWGMFKKGSDRLMGTIGLNNLLLYSKKTEVGYEIHPNYWRKGFVFEANKAVLDYAFGELELYRVGAITFPENTASIRLLEKLGFKKEGTLRGYLFQRNQSYDANVFSLLRPEWEEKWHT